MAAIVKHLGSGIRGRKDGANGRIDPMSDRAPHQHHSDDARADDALPTDGVTDEVRADAVQAQVDAADDGRDEADASHP